jgi:hypothetical protein
MCRNVHHQNHLGTQFVNSKLATPTAMPLIIAATAVIYATLPWLL